MYRYHLTATALCLASSFSASHSNAAPSCTGLSREPAGPTDLACTYAQQTPKPISAQASGGFVFSELTNNQYLKITLPGAVGSNESAVLFYPPVSHRYAFYSDADAPFRLYDEDGELVEPLFVEATLDACPEKLRRVALYELSDEFEYKIIFPAQSSSHLHLALTTVSELDFYPDADGDGFGALEGALKSWCGALPGYTLKGGDCDDTRATVHPEGTELCNGLDDDCDGTIDEATANLCSSDSAGNACVNAGKTSARCGCLADTDCAAPQVCRDNECRQPPEFPELPLGCAGISEAAHEHTCLHGEHGPYGAVSATAMDQIGFQTINSPHTLYTVSLAGAPGNNRSHVLFEPAVTSYYAFYTNEDYPLTLEDALGQEQRSVLSTSPETCPQYLERAHVYALDESMSYRVILGPASKDSVEVVVENVTGYPQSLWSDADGDGFANAQGQELRTWCAEASGYSRLDAKHPEDCDDRKESVWPGAIELCNGLDDDCDGTIDEGCEECSSDSDCAAGERCDSTTHSCLKSDGGKPPKPQQPGDEDDPDLPQDDSAEADTGGCSVTRATPSPATPALAALLLTLGLGLRRLLRAFKTSH